RARLARPLGVYPDGPPVPALLPAVIAIPALVGACAEALGDLHLRRREGGVLSLAGNGLLPRVLICDPTLTHDLSPHQTAADGMAALARCLEAGLSPGYNPPAEAIARDGLRRGLAHLERVVRAGGDRAARRELMAAG